MSNIAEGNYVTREELKRLENGRATAVWHNPVDNCAYIGETVKEGKLVPTYGSKVFDFTEFNEARALKDAGKLDKSELPYQGWAPEYLPLFTERVQMKEAGTITNAQFSSIDTTTVLIGLRNVNIRQFTLPEAVENISTDGLEYNIDVFTRFNISTNVPEGVAPWSKRGNVTAVTYDLTKDAGHVTATDEGLIKARQNLWQAHLTNIATDFRRAKSSKIADVLEAATNTTNVGDWDAFTSGLSDANAINHIHTELGSIDDNNGTGNVIASHRTGWKAFASNTFTNGPYQNFGGTQPGVEAGARVISGITQLPGVTWYIDNEITSDTVIVYDKSAVVCVNGPTRVGQYRMEAEGIDGYVSRMWYQCKITEQAKVRELTTVTT